jgi:TolB-like protein/Flp pilus assembly protein TadD/predicted Ser/Thr protein kinase
VLSRYENFERLGAGGMGVVYRAEDTTLKRPVALKFLTQPAFGGDEYARFLREARTAAALNHPSVCTIHEVGEVGIGEEAILGERAPLGVGTPFIAMELIEGRTLEATLKDSGPLALDELLRVAVQIAEGLAAAHAKGIVHRDLKPGNVMLTPDRRVKILDFGLAKPLGPAAEGDAVMTAAETVSAELTRDGRVLGTVAYMSPEQAMGKTVDSRSDVFSFGIMLYEMAAGHRPFRGESSTSTLAKILEAEPEPLDEQREDLPAELLRIVRRCLHKNPDARYNDTRDLLVALSELRVETTSGPARVAKSESATREGGAETIRGNRRTLAIVAAATVVIVALGGYWFTRDGRVSEQSPADAPPAAATLAERTMIAVLPLENLGPPEDEYFATGITDEITGRLAAVSSLGVISRTSAAQYAGTTKTTRQIGEELGIEYLLQGTVRWARGAEGSSRVRISPQLIRVSDDTTLWAQTYDAVIEDIFEVQSNIARGVVDQLGVVLLEPEARATQSIPTENQEAYQAYLRGMRHWDDGESLEASRSFQEAVALDPEFALAYARLAAVLSRLRFYGEDLSEGPRVQAEQALDRAIELAPGAPEVHAAIGELHYHRRDYDRALEEFEIAERSLPNDTEILSFKAFVLRRRGRWQEALATHEQVSRLNPRDVDSLAQYFETALLMREYEQSLRLLNQVIALDPKYAVGMAQYAWLTGGSLPEARRALESAPASRNLEYRQWISYWQETYQGRYREAIGRLGADADGWLRFSWLIRPRSLFEAWAHELLDEPELARDAYESARTQIEAELRVSPDDPRLHASLGLAYAGLGRKADAIREGERAVELQPVSKDAVFGPSLVVDLAFICAQTGEHDAAMDQIEYVLSVPAHFSVHLLRLDPRWRVLHDHPRYRALVSGETRP